MYAALDIGSNTLRMLVGECRDQGIVPLFCERRMTRLAGALTDDQGFAVAGMERTLAALVEFASLLPAHDICRIRAVGTAAFRRARNRRLFVDRIERESGFKVEIISGDEEAQLMADGVLSVLRPRPQEAVIFDIGGGSTEFVYLVGGRIRLQQSYPLGVVRLSEEWPDVKQRQQAVAEMVGAFGEKLRRQNSSLQSCRLIGTAGTMTTLAAIDLRMDTYDANRINDHCLTASWLTSLQAQFASIPAAQREQAAGMEAGRGDIIMPGLEIALELLKEFQLNKIRIADSGLLEGVLLDLCRAGGA